MPPITVLVNASAGRGAAVLKALCDDARCEVRSVESDDLLEALRDAVAGGADTVVVAGGDGTLAAAAAELADSSVPMGIVAAGTLNHFAHDHGLPLDPIEALEVALGGPPVPVDLGDLNGRIFLNTSAVGAYVPFVRIRERWEPWLGYYGGSLLAVLVAFIRLRSFWVELEVEGESRRYRSPLVFVGVDERELRPPKLGGRHPEGRSGLHVLIVKHTSRFRLVAMALRAVTRGIRPWAGESEVESLLVQRCTVTLPRPRGRVAVDGEIMWMVGPLEYRLRPGALLVRMPEPTP